MGYEASLERAWDELDRLALQDAAVSLLGDNYQVRTKERAVLLACGAPAWQMEAVLILHYLMGLLRHGYRPSSEWISFKETRDGKLFWPAFQESTIKPLVQSFQSDPEGLVRNLSERLGGRMVEGGDVAVELATFPGVFVRLIFWKGDEELPPEASLLFDRGLTAIYSTEDVAVLLMAVVQKAIE
ncbi:MAG: DUF3786 domain-containing protein [Methanothrix sp.]|jgi:hypothetical protein|nr:DUF3786 domain-containing protein [Methanothrix sp.]